MNREDRDGRVDGVGLGLRTRHYGDILGDILGNGPDVPFFEVLADNYAHGDGPPLHFLERVRDRYPIVFHGVGMSLGGADPLDRDYLARIGALVDGFEPAWYSEHLAWTSIDGRHYHELLPLPYTVESVRVVSDHVQQVQDTFGQRMLVENASGYLQFEASALTECEFVCAVLAEADCALLLDVNNLYVNAMNHGFDPRAFLAALPRERVAQMHLAGHDDHGGALIDAHGSLVAEPVWQLFEHAVACFPDAPICLEWDRDVPPFEVLLQEKGRADEIVGRCRRPLDTGASDRTPSPRPPGAADPPTGEVRQIQLRLARALRPAPPNAPAPDDVSDLLRPAPRIPTGEGMAIYRGSLFGAKLEALRDIFPVCAALVGKDCFRSIARQHVDGRGSAYADLGHTGDGFPELLPRLDFLSDVPYLADVARLELAWHTAFTAPQPAVRASDRSARAVGDAVGRAPSAHRFVLSPSAILLESRYPVLAIWAMHQEEADQDPAATIDLGSHLDLDPGLTAEGDRLIVHRRGLDMCVDPLEAAPWRLLSAAAAGQSVAEAIAQVETHEQDSDGERALDAIRTCFARGWIVGVEPVVAAVESHSVDIRSFND